MKLSANFSLDEFARVSNRPIGTDEHEHAIWHAQRLQLVRNALNQYWAKPEVGGDWQIAPTSFLRATGDHASGGAVDWNVRDKNGTRYDTLTKWARDWLALNHAQDFAELLWEDDRPRGGGPNNFHVHQTRRGYSLDDDPGDPPEILDETESGGWVQAVINPIPAPARPIAVALAVVGAAYLLTKAQHAPA